MFHHVRVRLFDFVEQHHGIRIAADLFGQLAAFLVTDVARRRADQARDVELLHVFAHVELDERLRVAEHLFRERLGQQGLAHAGRAEQQETCRWAASGLSNPRANGATPCTCAETRFVLADDDLFHLVFHGEQPLRLRLAPCA